MKTDNSYPIESSPPIMGPQEVKKTVQTFAWASFLHDMGSDMVFPIWPLFITSFLGADMTVLGLIDGLGDALVAISQAISGYISDKIKKRKIFIWLGYLLGAGSKIGYYLSPVWGWLIPFRVMDRAGKMRGAPRDAVVADISTEANRGKHFGQLRGMDNLGAVVGILFTITFFGLLGYRHIFLIAAFPSLLATLLILWKFKEKKPAERKIFKGMSFRQVSPNFRLFLILSSIFSLGNFSYSFLLIYAKNFGYTAVFIPVLYLIYTAVASGASFPFGKLADSLGRKKMVFASFIFWAIVCIVFLFEPSHLGIIIAFIFYGLHLGAFETAQRAFVSDLAPEQYRASSLGGYQMVIGLCALPASLIAGLLWDKINLKTPLVVSIMLTIIAVVMLFFVKETANQDKLKNAS